jgi:2,4-dienoyl-CoA reductase-like NADH-dependent reductase (Old Yellow Enzyme family)
VNLFSSLAQRSVTLPNRIVVSPMCQYCAVDGFANDWHLVHLGTRAVGGAGTIIAESTAVTENGRISAHDLGIWKDEHVEFLARITDFIRRQGSVAGIQIGHAGRKASTRRPWEGGGVEPVETGGWTDVYGPTDEPYSPNNVTPHALSKAQIQELIHSFANAARRSLAAGFQLVEIHAAHGYLLHEFLSPLSNRRDDEYGGSYENRTRFVREVVAAVRSEWPDELPVWMRISATDWTEGGWDGDQSVQLAKDVAALGVDLIDCSSGGNVPGARIPAEIGYQVPFAAAIKEAGVAAGAVGLITDVQYANSLIEGNQADVVLLARELLRNPYFPIRAAKDLGVDVSWPPQYDRARD